MSQFEAFLFATVILLYIVLSIFAIVVTTTLKKWYPLFKGPPASLVIAVISPMYYILISLHCMNRNRVRSEPFDFSVES